MKRHILLITTLLTALCLPVRAQQTTSVKSQQTESEQQARAQQTTSIKSQQTKSQQTESQQQAKAQPTTAQQPATKQRPATQPLRPDAVTTDSLEVITYNLDQLRASIYLNECAYSLTKIIKSGNKIVLTDEQYKLNNTYKWENITDYSTVFDFRQSMQTELNGMIINETNRERFKKEFERKQNAAARDALLGAISGVQFNVNVVSIVSNVLISSARAYLDYGKKKEDLAAEMDDRTWQLEQYHMDAVTSLRRDLFNVINQTFGEYKISDNMYLRENNFEDFFNILSNKDPELKLVGLNENVKTFQSFPPYWYELGCANIDMYEYSHKQRYLSQAWECFAVYEKINRECPMFITDERVGIIALYNLKYRPNLSKSEIYKLIDKVKTNISKDASALLFAALQYCDKLSSYDESINMMRQCLANPDLTGKNEFVLAAAAIWDKVSSTHLKNLYIKALATADNIDLATYISFLYKISKDQNIDTYPMMRKLQSSLNIIWDAKEMKFQVNCAEGSYFQYDCRTWKATMEERNLIDLQSYLYQTTLDFTQPKHYYASQNEYLKRIKSKVPYFKKHPLEIENINLVSTTQLNGRQYYYLAADSKWNDIAVFLKYKNSGKDAKKYDKPENIENKYIKFYDKNAVKDITYTFTLSEPDKANLDITTSDYRYNLKLNIQDSQNAKIVLNFVTDFLAAGNTVFYLDGLEYNNEYFRF